MVSIVPATVGLKYFISPAAGSMSFIVLDIGSLIFISLFYILLPLAVILTLGGIVFSVLSKASKAASLGLNLAQSNEELEGVFGIAGYEYDPKQDIFYSILNPWQRKFGYCKLYDEALAPLSMIVDCEPIIFECYGQKWMIEFWKGQYCLNTGCEIGIYKEVIDLGIVGMKGSFFMSVKDEEMMHMAFSLKKKGKELFYREGRHWWLTGFKMGEFSNPSELTMDIAIQFNDLNMCYAFINAMLSVGYSEDEIVKIGNRVYFTFGKPRTKQPFTRTRLTDWIIQRKNKFMCDQYNKATEEYKTIEEKLAALKMNEPVIYNKAINIGKTPEVYKAYNKFKRYVE
ncbi:DUF4474 domain-containing protein [Acetivibrio clariflavus]|uniref:DUF4474 domain-containing protein n=1 Tax=Acetivibrio clariflavus (strain DSM 19732 / NBRC 101661 / EBR45) TaxID=720554 RepID=G8LW88_ACECE|nr:DUF4474 domain-containing protein [Acetivibrio clariflavus]AEV69735.1 hypothetical protein Clocl_3219 [Acetivibrio clariflavus DSM 19732]HOQ01376.1 DUF4474 domain-containing protein [Acetivibrio clariflavus]HPU41160.1 DUF4474 domain-containing protein [Acetivibrio clariflavus]